jgi:hypothetical protein
MAEIPDPEESLSPVDGDVVDDSTEAGSGVSAAKNDETAPSGAGAGAKKLSGPVLGIVVALAALLAGAGAFGATRVMMNRTSPCEQAKQEILAIREALPDAKELQAQPALARRLYAAGEGLRESCIYNDGIMFEQEFVMPWLNEGAPPPTAPGAQPGEVAVEIPLPTVPPPPGG